MSVMSYLSVGLDYGTTNSLLTVFTPEMDLGQMIQFRQKSEVFEGGRRVPSPKRLMTDLSSTDNNTISRYIQECLKRLVEQMKGEQLMNGHSSISLAITVPNSFRDTQCRLLKETVVNQFSKDFPGQIQESDVHLIPEPVAAALYYAYASRQEDPNQDTKYVLVSDIGGGTTDLAVVRVEFSQYGLQFKVICTESAVLGGDDIDKAIAAYFLKSQPARKSFPPEALQRACCVLKEVLSKAEVARQHVLKASGERYPDSELKLSQEELAKILRDGFLKRYESILENLKRIFSLKLSTPVERGGEGYARHEVKSVMENKLVLLPVGGTSRISLVYEKLKSVFSVEPFKLHNEKDKFDSVARGAAIYAAIKARDLITPPQCIVIENRTVHRIAIRYAGGRLFECVGKDMPDDRYVSNYRINRNFISPDGLTFKVPRITFFQGGSGESQEGSVEIGSIQVPGVFTTNGRPEDEIFIDLVVCVDSGRLDSVIVIIKNGDENGQDFIKPFNLKV